MKKLSRPVSRQALKNCEIHINQDYKVHELCGAFPTRLTELIAQKGERLSH